MNEVVSIVVPRHNVNDATVEVLEWLVSPGQFVEKDQPLVEIETGKSTTQIEAPAAGYVHCLCESGAQVAVGGTIGYVTNVPADLPTNERGNGHVKSDSPGSTTSIGTSEIGPSGQMAPTSWSAVNEERENTELSLSQTRFSAAALKIAAKHELNVREFGDRRGLVRAADVLAGVAAEDGAKKHGGPFAAESMEAARGCSIQTPLKTREEISVRYEDLPRRKKSEARILRSGRNNTLASLVSVSCPTWGLRAAIETGPTRGESLTAVILFETARLLRKYPLFNAYYDSGRVAFHEQVNVGFAIDAGHGLMVPVIRRADKKSLAEINGELNERVVQYLSDELPGDALCGATFTVSDLSSEEVVSFVPLIAEGQSAILGVGGEFFPPGSSRGLFNLMLAFDHQLSEGRMAAAFLRELRRRLHGYEDALGNAGSQARCTRCSRTASEVRALDAVLVPSAVPPGMVCSLCLAGY